MGRGGDGQWAMGRGREGSVQRDGNKYKCLAESEKFAGDLT